MARKVTPKVAMAFLKVIIVLCFSWPLLKTASRFQVIRFKTLRFLFCMNVIVLIVPMTYTIYYNDYDLPKITKLWCLLGAFVQVPLEISLLGVQYDRLQNLISEMEYNFECAQVHERDVYQRYTDKCVPFYAAFTFAVFLTAIVMSIVTPLVEADQAFPTEAKYPFDVEREPVKTFIFVHQFIAIWQCFSTVCLSSFIGFLIWFTAARFEILSQQFRAVNGTDEIIACVHRHIKLLRYAQEVIIAFRSVILALIIICTWTFIASGLTIVSQSTTADKTHFMILWITGLIEVYACAWPADHLMDASTDVAQAVYDSVWYNQNVNFQKSIWFILLRSQVPTAVSVSSFIPAISLRYYASYVSTAFSYLMTLRIVFLEDDATKS
ncbi:odorant receptor 49b-like [Harpegnathos saltator]|nr:odorant receptor 49b-like [Harpegnathos saltator]